MTPLVSNNNPYPLPSSNIALMNKVLLGKTIINIQENSGSITSENLNKVFGFIDEVNNITNLYYLTWISQRSIMPQLYDTSYSAHLYWKQVSIDESKLMLENSFSTDFDTSSSKLVVEISECGSHVSEEMTKLLDSISSNEVDAIWALSFASCFPSMLGFNVVNQILTGRKK